MFDMIITLQPDSHQAYSNSNSTRTNGLRDQKFVGDLTQQKLTQHNPEFFFTSDLESY